MDSQYIWLNEFKNGNYKQCRLILEGEIIPSSQIAALTMTNNIIVCKFLELLPVLSDENENFECIELGFKEEIMKLETLPMVPIDLTLVMIYNILWIYWNSIDINSSDSSKLFMFEEQISFTVDTLSRVFSLEEVENKLTKIQTILQLNFTSFELFDATQVTLINAIRLLIATSAQDEFLHKITFSKKDFAQVPEELICEKKNRCEDFPLLLFPILHGIPVDCNSLDPQDCATNIKLLNSALLAKIYKFKSELSCLPESCGDTKIRALLLYLKAWCKTKEGTEMEVAELLEQLFAMKDGRDGTIGCRGRILQGKLEVQKGKTQKGVNVLRQVAKFYGHNWLLLQVLADIYREANQIDAYIPILEFLLESLLLDQGTIYKFEDKILSIVHGDKKPSISQVLYELSCAFLSIQKYNESSERLLQLLARKNHENVPDRTQLIRETAVVLFHAGKVDEALVTVSKLTIYDSQVGNIRKKNADLDAVALIISAKIKMSTENWQTAIEDIDRAVANINTSSKERPLELLAKCHQIRAQCTKALNDVNNTKHSYLKAINVKNDERKILVEFVSYLIEVKEKDLAKRIWWDFQEQHPPKNEVFQETQVGNPVFEFISAASISDSDVKILEEKIKVLFCETMN